MHAAYYVGPASEFARGVFCETCPFVSICVKHENAGYQLHVWSLVIYLGWFVPDTISAVSGSSRFLTFVEQQQQQEEQGGGQFPAAI